MVEMAALYNLAEQENIIVLENQSLEEEFLGLYVRRKKKPIISLDKSLEKDVKLKKCVFAEEFGHHFTTPPGDFIPRKILDYNIRVSISKAEYKAARWGALFLVPQKSLDHALLNLKLDAIWELADYFEITEEVMSFRLDLVRSMGNALYNA